MGANTKMRDPNKKLWPLDSAEAKALPAIGRVYRIGLDYKIKVAVDSQPADAQPQRRGGARRRGRLLVAEFFTGTIFEPKGKKLTALVTGLRGADGLEEDAKRQHLRVQLGAGQGLALASGARPAKPAEPEVLAEGFQSAADFYLDTKGKQLLLPDMKAGHADLHPAAALAVAATADKPPRRRWARTGTSGRAMHGMAPPQQGWLVAPQPAQRSASPGRSMQPSGARHLRSPRQQG